MTYGRGRCKESGQVIKKFSRDSVGVNAGNVASARTEKDRVCN